MHDGDDGCASGESSRIYPRPIKFRLGRSVVHAVANLFDDTFPHVFRLAVRPRFWYRPFQYLVSRLPSRLQGLARRHWPGPFLPPRVVLKTLAKEADTYTELFENEQRMYRKLQPLQGHRIPVYYGEAQSEGKRALVLSLVDGVSLRAQVEPRLSVEAFRRRVEAVAAELQTFGVVYDDLKLDNLLLVDDRLVVLDLEWVFEPEPEFLGQHAQSFVVDFVTVYKRYLKSVDDTLSG
ncbi:Protein kinase-like domain protein [Niveomyces insectorum RCEF 264]|uniref:Protein kinase-like domain protein n=1 Tax=Niveomyces insectorum RCEF 264 TaxID=1081102 RepID=A0A167YXN5_9HYPO|nr:Protein kinase-like domain protein [Niveomyces insectorum RCEF 264]